MKRQVTKIHLHFIKPNENQIRKNKKVNIDVTSYKIVPKNLKI